MALVRSGLFDTGQEIIMGFKASVLIALFAILTLGGCAGVVSPVGTGIIVTNVDGPITVGPHESKAREGKSCATNVLGLAALGDASIETAKQNGSISSVTSISHESFSILFIYAKFCTVVTGS